MPRRDEGIDQGQHILHCGLLAQHLLVGLLAGDALRAQLDLQRRERHALARQHHDALGLNAGGHAQGDPARGLAAFERAQGFVQHPARGAQAVAPGGGVLGGALVGLVRAWDQGQGLHPAGGRGFGTVRAKAIEAAVGLRLLHDGVDGTQHGGRVAARVVGGQALAAQGLHDELPRGGEHHGVGTAKAIDALLGVAHDEDAGRTGATARAGIARQPGLERLPLQRVGVLKLIDQQVAHARVQALLHPGRDVVVVQQGERGALDVVHVHPAALALELGKTGDELAREAHHALVVLMGVVLLAGEQQALQLGLGLLRRLELDQVRGQTVFLGHEKRLAQRGQSLLRIGLLEGVDDRVRGGSGRFVFFCAQGLGKGQPAGARRIACQGVARALEAGQLGRQHVKARHRAVNMPGLVGQLKLHPARQRGAQGLVRVVAAQRAHQVGVVIAQASIVGHLPQKGSPQLGHGVFVVLQQLIGRGQAQLLQHRQRGRAQQRGKPAVKGADLHRAAVGEQGLI